MDSTACMTGQETRSTMTDYGKESGVEKQDEFAMLTNIIHQEWTGLSVKKSQRNKRTKVTNLEITCQAELIFLQL
jgi:hypothetical protein